MKTPPNPNVNGDESRHHAAVAPAAQLNPLSQLLNAPDRADTALTVCGPNPPPAPEPVLLAPASVLMPQPHRKPRNGKIARLPKPVRDVVNRMLANNIPQQKIVGALEELGIKVTQHNISNWKIHGGYREWRLAQEHALRLRLHQDNLVDLVRRHDSSELSESGLQMAATHLSQFFHTPEAQKLLASNPKEYERRVAMLTRVSAQLKGLQQYRDDCARGLGWSYDPARIRMKTTAELEKLRSDWSCVSGKGPKDPDQPHHNELPDPAELYRLESTEKPKTMFPSLEELLELERRRAARASGEPGK